MAGKRIGIMGGSFNPIHRRHLQIAACAISELNLESVLFIPNGNPPHKLHELESAAHRFEMTRLAVMPYPNFTVSDIEITRSGVIYTFDTLHLLHTQYPGSEFVYLIGEDTLHELLNWRQPSDVFKLTSFAVCPRKNKQIEYDAIVQTLQKAGAVLHFLPLDPLPISASEIRQKLSMNIFDQTQLTPEVIEYIRIAGLYGSSAFADATQTMYDMLKSDLSDSRLLHSLGVAYTAKMLANAHGLDANACELAGLLHDCAKHMPLKQQQNLAKVHKLQLSSIEMNTASLLHAAISAVVAKEQYGVQNADILNAIAVHTVGYAGMSPMEMVIFLADKIEPFRKHIPKLDEIRSIAEYDLYRASYMMLSNSKNHVLQANRPLHPDTDQTIQWLYDRIQ